MATKQEYIEALERMEESYYNFDNCMSAMNKFKEDVNLLTGLVNEHFEERAEMNFEHYFEYLSKLKMSNFALIDGRFTKCSDTSCSECDFNGDCIEGKFRWLKQPYKKLTYKLNKFEFDLLNAHKDSGMQKCISNYRPLLELHEKGYFKDINTSTPIHEILDNCEVV